ncbi:hypothetical protein M0802_014484 [Mischocyttarus mexicanus]|nr:hypothetical protein M0802_014484 [Mischocyttarus mexicanus]
MPAYVIAVCHIGFSRLRVLSQYIRFVEGGEKISSVAKSTNLNESTIRTVKKNADNIKKTVADGCPLGAKCVTRTRNSNMVKIERALMIWLEDCMAKTIPISGNLIKQRALKIYEHLRTIGHSYAGQENHSLVASKEWFEKLKKRTVSSACAEIKPTTLNACWKPLLPQMVQAIQDDSTISLPVTEIVNIASRLGDEEFAVNHQNVRELVH